MRAISTYTFEKFIGQGLFGTILYGTIASLSFIFVFDLLLLFCFC